MNRRQALKTLGSAVFFISPFFTKVLRALDLDSGGPSAPQYVLIHDPNSDFDYERLLQAADHCLSPRDNQWRQKLVLWDLRVDSAKIGKFRAQYGRNTKASSWPVLITVPTKSRLATLLAPNPDVEIWTPEWLKAYETKFKHVCYPLSDSGGWWSVEGDWNPTLDKVLTHLSESPNHTSGHFQLDWLTALKFEELQSLHSDHHREMINEGSVTWKDVNGECATG